MYQEFVAKVTTVDPSAKFLLWFYNGSEIRLEIDASNTPLKNIKVSVSLKDYLGAYNRTKEKKYWRVNKIHAASNFQGIKDNVVGWRKQDLHWINEDYIQAKRISTIGLLAYT